MSEEEDGRARVEWFFYGIALMVVVGTIVGLRERWFALLGW